MAPGVFVTPGCPTHRHRICQQQPYSLPTTLIALNLSLKVMVWFLSLLPSYALADPVLKIWVTFLATGLKRGANISKKLNHKTSNVSLGTGQMGVECFALGEVHTK